jgi:hypothetical protein
MCRPWKRQRLASIGFGSGSPQPCAGRWGVSRSVARSATKDFRGALLRHTEVTAEVAAEWEGLRRGPNPSPLARRPHADPGVRFCTMT